MIRQSSRRALRVQASIHWADTMTNRSGLPVIADAYVNVPWRHGRLVIAAIVLT